MDLKDLSKPLPITSVEFRVQSINKGGYATILAYKDARVDMSVLDDVVGPCNWKREHARENKNCIVSIYCEKKKQWISKEDTGTESMSDKQKGLASDSFKRACFNWGIGRELYDYPVIQVKLKSNEYTLYKDNKGKEKGRATWDLKIRQWNWVIKFDDSKQVEMLTGIDETGNTRYSFNSGVTQSLPHYPVANFYKAAAYLKAGNDWSEIEKNFFVSASAKKVILALKNQ